MLARRRVTWPQPPNKFDDATRPSVSDGAAATCRGREFVSGGANSCLAALIQPRPSKIVGAPGPGLRRLTQTQGASLFTRSFARRDKSFHKRAVR
jgi:hypothetical protein